MTKKYLRCVAVGLLFSLCAVPSMNIKAEEMVQPVETPVQDIFIQEGLTAEQQAEMLMQQQLAQVTAEQANRQLVIIGDSRTVGMKNAVGKNNNVWSAEIGKGLKWMKNIGVPAIEENINENTDVVILMGVNDVRFFSQIDKYTSYLNEKAAAWTALGANVYYVSVNPVAYESARYPGISNPVIESWNAKIQQGFSENIHYLDTYTPLVGNITSRDGLHYDKSTYRTIYSLINQGIILDKVQQKIATEC